MWQKHASHLAVITYYHLLVMVTRSFRILRMTNSLLSSRNPFSKPCDKADICTTYRMRDMSAASRRTHMNICSSKAAVHKLSSLIRKYVVTTTSCMVSLGWFINPNQGFSHMWRSTNIKSTEIVTK